MDSYSQMQNNIFQIFNSTSWKTENIVTRPANYVGTTTPEEHVRISVIPSGAGVNLYSKSGVMIIDIFTKAGNGPKRPFIIADKLDSYLAGRSIEIAQGKTVQFSSSSLQPSGKDSEDPSLYRYTYTIPLNYFEVK
jgi:sorbitol-specific phosphotransferase system component IIBC